MGTIVKLSSQQKSQRSVVRGHDQRAGNYSQLEVAEMNIQLFIFASLFLCTFAAYGGSYDEDEFMQPQSMPSRRRPGCPVRHFCHCFKRMVHCVKTHRNASMEMRENPDEYAASEMMDQDPAAFEAGAVEVEHPTVEKKNKSGNHTGIKKCIHHFVRCMHRRPGGPPRPMVGTDRDGMFKKMGMGNKLSLKSKIMAIFSKVKSGFGKVFGKKKSGHMHFGSKVRPFGGSRFGPRHGGSRFGPKFGGRGKMGHHRRHHHRRHRRGPFFKCFMMAKLCKHKAKKSKKMMKMCTKKFVKCILGTCRRGRGRRPFPMSN